MEEKIISPKHLFYSGMLGHLVVLIIASLMFRIVSEGKQIGPILIFGIIFILTVLVTVFHLDRQVYIQILNNNMVKYGTLFMKAVVPLKSVEHPKRIWFNTYKLKINRKTYIFYAFRNDALYFRNLIEKDSE